MKLTFLGTAAAEGVPAMFCSCPNCNEIRKLGLSEYRTRTQLLIDEQFSIDFPPEAYYHSLRFGVDLSALKYVLVTHSHMDHFYAHDFILRGYKYAQLKEDVLHIYGNAEVNKVFHECTAREMKEDVKPHLSITEIKPYQVFEVGGYKVISVLAQHSVTEDALLFYIEKDGKGYLHLHDTGRIPLKSLEFLAQNGAKANLVAYDCTFIEHTAGEVSRHMGIEDDMAMHNALKELGVVNDETKIVLTHFSHNANPTRAHLAEIEKKYGVIAAYDGLTLEI